MRGPVLARVSKHGARRRGARGVLCFAGVEDATSECAGGERGGGRSARGVGGAKVNSVRRFFLLRIPLKSAFSSI
jgi:hypothetical protein